MLKEKYILYPDKTLENIYDLKKFCEKYFNKLGYNIKFVEKIDKFNIYLNIENYLFKVTLRLLGPSLVQYKIPLDKWINPILGEQQLVIKKI